jgi:hypothetical protein
VIREPEAAYFATCKALYKMAVNSYIMTLPDMRNGAERRSPICPGIIYINVQLDGEVLKYTYTIPSQRADTHPRS